MFIILDTETTNDLDCPLVYDLGFAIIDKNGKVYASYSYVVADIFCNKELMSYAFFANKIPQYWEEIENGSRILKSFYSIEKIFHKVCRDWEIKEFIAHNVRFDYLALQTTKRYLTKSRYRFFFPYNSKFIDTLKLSRKVFIDDENYNIFCKENDYITKNNQNRYTAEIIYRFLTQNNNFEEAHTGLADCLIEKEIFSYCVKKDSIDNGYLW